ncbi:MAG: CRISPR-associated endonuclease Cas2 [Eubacteriales bacterium]|nr:CRISPR-associated endonuclease Cas2 [Eubacteriales bacterium]
MDMQSKKYNFSDIIEDPNKKLILIIYDIVDNKRRTELVKLLEGYGIRVQKSAFEALLTSKKYNSLVKSIIRLIHEEDNVRIYRLNSSNEILYFGTSDTIFEEDVVII